MKIWLINHYAVPPQYYPLARPSLFAKNLIKMGHEVTIIAASTVHNSNKNLIEGKEKVKKETVDGIPYVYIKCSNYEGNGLKRAINILEYAIKLPRVCKTLEKPDAIVATSFDPISCYQGIRLANKYGIAGVAEIADLWPETLISYGLIKETNPFVHVLRIIEKWIYTNAQAVIFTMEGAYDYILERKWEKIIPRDKVFYINNGVDLIEFKKNCKIHVTDDPDLLNHSLFKVVYTGAIRKVNNIGLLLDAAKRIGNRNIKFLIWGDGDELEGLEERKRQENIDNVEFKGRVGKEYIPYITSCADLNIAHNTGASILRFGISFNKIFDYIAAGKPILVDFSCKYNPVIDAKCGTDLQIQTADEIAKEIMNFYNMEELQYKEYCKNAVFAAEKYDFARLTERLLQVIDYAEKTKKKRN